MLVSLVEPRKTTPMYLACTSFVVLLLLPSLCFKNCFFLENQMSIVSHGLLMNYWETPFQKMRQSPFQDQVLTCDGPVDWCFDDGSVDLCFDDGSVDLCFDNGPLDLFFDDGPVDWCFDDGPVFWCWACGLMF